MSQLKDLIQKVNSAPSVREAVVLAQDRWAKNYYLVTGKKDGMQRFESELLNYLDIVAEKPDLAKIQDKFTHFAAVMKAAVTGLSFRSDGHLYPIVYGGKIKVQIGAHGKREMLNQMKEVKFVHEAQLVIKGDSFKHDKMNNKIIEHVSTDKTVVAKSLDDVIASYCRIEYHDGRIIDVVVYHEDLVKAKNASKNKGAGSTWDLWFGEMAKKVSYHRAKKLYHRYPEGLEFNVGDDNSDPSDGSDEPIQYAQEVQDNVDTDTGEIKSEDSVQEPTIVETKESKDALPFT